MIGALEDLAAQVAAGGVAPDRLIGSVDERFRVALGTGDETSEGQLEGVSPGPVLTLVITETLKGGWLRGAAVAAGPLLADGPIVLVALGVMNELPEQFVPAISLVGGIFLLYLAATATLNARGARLPTN